MSFSYSWTDSNKNSKNHSRTWEVGYRIWRTNCLLHYKSALRIVLEEFNDIILMNAILSRVYANYSSYINLKKSLQYKNK